MKDKLTQNGMQLNEDKCVYCQEEVRVLGFIVSANGVRPDPQKVRAIKGFLRPTNQTELQKFLGMLEFYGRFIKGRSSIKAPLNQLLCNNAAWHWGPKQEEAFCRLKEALAEDSLLTPFNPNETVVLTTDASPTGIGAVLEQNGRPVLFVSKTLTSAEKKYAQIEREALAIVWATKRLHKFVYGRRFQLVTDNKPLMYIFHPSKSLSAITAARLQRWAMSMMAYDYEVVHKLSHEIPVSDALSRCTSSGSETVAFEVNAIQDCIMEPPTSKERIRATSKKDPLMRQLYNQIMHGWRTVKRGPLMPYAKLRNDLVIEDGLIFKGNRLVIPPRLRKSIINELHKGHIGADSMKSLARHSVWWNNIDKDIEHHVKACDGCCMGKDHVQPQWQSWPEEMDKWKRVHMDFAGPLRDGTYALVLIDAYSKWPEVHLMNRTTSAETIRRLRRTFAQEGVPETLVSDNGPQFVSGEMTDWLSRIGCKHVRTPPYHPRSNGIAERFVRTLKNHLRAAQTEDLQTAVDRFLIQYRNREHPATGVAPATIMRGQLLRSPITSLAKDPPKVWVRGDFKKEALYQPGTIVRSSPYSDTTVTVQMDNGAERLCHKEQLKVKVEPLTARAEPSEEDEFDTESGLPIAEEHSTDTAQEETATQVSGTTQSSTLPGRAIERTKRNRRPLDRLQYNELGRSC